MSYLSNEVHDAFEFQVRENQNLYKEMPKHQDLFGELMVLLHVIQSS